MIIDIISLLSLVLIMSMLRRFVVSFPSIVSCMIRWKENVNLEESLKLSHNRNLIAAALVIPFCLTVNAYSLPDIRIMEGKSDVASLGITMGIFLTYVIFRRFAVDIFIPRKKRRQNKAACNSERTFFIILAAILIIFKWITSMTDMSADSVRSTILWISGFIYLLFIIRKYQIFQSYYPIFPAFLYLCALEIIPTGTLIVSAIIF